MQIENILKNSLSTNKVESTKAILYAIDVYESSGRFGVVDTVLTTQSDRLLYIGSGLESITDCAMILP